MGSSHTPWHRQQIVQLRAPLAATRTIFHTHEMSSSVWRVVCMFTQQFGAPMGAMACGHRLLSHWFTHSECTHHWATQCAIYSSQFGWSGRPAKIAGEPGPTLILLGVPPHTVVTASYRMRVSDVLPTSDRSSRSSRNARLIRCTTIQPVNLLLVQSSPEARAFILLSHLLPQDRHLALISTPLLLSLAPPSSQHTH